MWEQERHRELLQTRRTHPDPRVRHRAQALLLLTDEHSVSEVARLFQSARHRIRAWRDRYLAEGISGLADKKRMGRPPKLGNMERLWRFLKGKLSYHRWWADLPALEEATEEILAHMRVC